MVKKGKFKALSYIIEDYLIYYKSLNKRKKYIAFSLIKAKNLQPLISILNKFLEKRFLAYYSIQIDIKSKPKKFFLLNFEENDKDLIIKYFNLIYGSILQKIRSAKFFKSKLLEKKFLDIFQTKLDLDLIILKSKDTLLIKNHIFRSTLKFYTINFPNILNKATFIDTFIHFVPNINSQGKLIFNFRMNLNDKLILGGYFVEVNNIMNSDNEIQEKLNDFFGYNILTRHKLEIRHLFYYIWRLEISNNYKRYLDYCDLFEFKSHYDFHNLLTFDNQFESNLVKNKIKFKKINNNLFFIEDWLLFYVTFTLNSKLILNLLKRFYSKYYIYILILKENKADALLQRINSLENVKLLNSNEFCEIDLNCFKKRIKSVI